MNLVFNRKTTNHIHKTRRAKKEGRKKRLNIFAYTLLCYKGDNEDPPKGKRMNANAKLTNIAAGFLVQERKVLVTLRKKEQQWELPGGKLEGDEKFDEALIRELKEELNITVKPLEEIASVELDIDDNTVYIIMFILADWNPAGFTLHVHDDSKLVTLAELKTLNLCEADKLFVEQYEVTLKKYID